LTGLHEKSSQGDSALPEIYSRLGVSSEFKGDKLILKKIPVAAAFFECDFSDCPDIAQTVAVTCLGLNLGAKLTGLSTLIHKETDRLSALKTELEKFGASVHLTKNSLELKPATGHVKELITIDTYDDHRMAMSFAPLAFCFSQVKINDPAVVVKSYPEFWQHLQLTGVSVA
jgi:3-phosphoshikimate 1-carboxyvinyltransferase